MDIFTGRRMSVGKNQIIASHLKYCLLSFPVYLLMSDSAQVTIFSIQQNQVCKILAGNVFIHFFKPVVTGIIQLPGFVSLKQKKTRVIERASLVYTPFREEGPFSNFWHFFLIISLNREMNSMLAPHYKSMKYESLSVLIVL